MENNNISEFIFEKLNNYDKINDQYSNLIKSKDYELKDDMTMIFYDDKGKELYKGKASNLGVFDGYTQIWTWSWSTPNFSSLETQGARDILNYALDLEPQSNSNIHFYLKSHLINSRLYFENTMGLEIHLALCLYINKKAKFIFQKSKQNIQNKGEKIIVYYLIY
jgi:hypothetical protein